MIKIPSVQFGTIHSTTRSRKTKGAQGSGFSFLVEEDAPAGPSVVSGSSPVNNVSALLSLQEVTTSPAQTREAIQNGNQLLDTLETLRLGLLTGSVPLTLLEEMESLVADIRAASVDPALEDILSEIELRSAVELAKLEQAQKEQGK